MFGLQSDHRAEFILQVDIVFSIAFLIATMWSASLLLVYMTKTLVNRP